MVEWWNTKTAASGVLIIGIGGGGVITYFLSPEIGIPASLVFLLFGVYLLIRAYRAVPPETRIKIALRNEAHTKCKRGDHSWFNDSRLEGLAYGRRETSYEHNDFGGVRSINSTKACDFCGYTEGGLIF